MDLLGFVNRQKSLFPITIIWPDGAPVAVPHGAAENTTAWVKLPDRRIQAVYEDKDELALCLQITQWIREDDNFHSNKTGIYRANQIQSELPNILPYPYS
jgi:hypothetical protein